MIKEMTMINWKEMRNLHVIGKLEDILNRWFGVELVWADSHGRVQSGIMDKDFAFKSHFAKCKCTWV